jgi:Na+-driven multidrug efflux pump
MLLGLAFSSICNVCGQVLITIDREHYLIGLLIVSTLVCAGLDYAAIRLGYGINGVALATSISYSVSSLLVLWGCLQAIEPRWTRSIAFIASVCAPTLLLAAFFAAAFFFGPLVAPGVVGRELLSWLGYFVVTAIVLWIGMRNVFVREAATFAGSWLRTRLSKGRV